MAILARVQAGKLRGDVGVLTHRHAVVVAQHTAVHLLQVFMHTGTVGTLVGIVAVQTIGASGPSAYPALEIILMTSMRKPSMPFWNQKFIMSKT